MDNIKKNVLLIGDLRTAFNYGAIATTESLIQMIRGKVDQEHFRTIEYRSFYSETPVDGWGTAEMTPTSAFKKDVKRLLNKIGLLNVVQQLRNKKTDMKKYHVPVRYDDYELFTENVLNGKALPYERKMVEWADIVIINAEGNIVNGTDENGVYRLGGLYVLYMAYFSKVILNKQCYIINHTVDPANLDIQDMITKIYPLMDGIYVREHASDRLLKSWGLSNQRYVPDALFAYNFDSNINLGKFEKKWGNRIDFSKPYICIGDSSGIKNRYNQVKWDVPKTYNQLIKELKEEICNQIVFIDGYNGNNEDIQEVIDANSLIQVNLHNCSYKELFFILKGAEIFISGRWHASIISLKAHTPILLFGSDSHKTKALYDEIDWPFYFFDTKTVPLNISKMCKVAKEILDYDCTKVWGKVDNLSDMAWQNVDMLE